VRQQGFTRSNIQDLTSYARDAHAQAAAQMQALRQAQQGSQSNGGQCGSGRIGVTRLACPYCKQDNERIGRM
jgi:hypothetical protein